MRELAESQKKDIKEVIADKLGMDIDKIGDESTLRSDLCADSLDVMELIVDMEKMFDISIPDDEWGDDLTVVGLFNIVEQRIN